MRHAMVSFFRLVLPAIPVALLALLFHWLAPVQSWSIPTISSVLAALCVAVLLVTWRLRRYNLFWIGAVATVMSLGRLHVPSSTALTPGDTVLLLHLIWSGGHLLILGLSISRDRGIFSLHGLLRLLLILIPSVIILFWVQDFHWFPTLYRNQMVRNTLATTTLPWVVSMFTLACMVIRFVFQRHRTAAGIGWVILFTGLACSVSHTRSALLLCTAALLALLVSVVEHLVQLAFEDELTELPARRALNRALNTLRPPYTLAVLDVDHFKRFNDRYGHDVGDEVLRKVASRIERPGHGGQAYRAGGEEFVLIFPGRLAEESKELAERLRKSIQDQPFRIRNPRKRKRSSASGRGRGSSTGRNVRITVSIGIADSSRSNSPGQVLKQADKALYRAKKTGRNRTSL